ncbi:MAG: tRNA (N(6)-L-threonylcarbamoyladenosine(37)-C(2))-methylthiotransferase MtaB [Planctomycetaceae bacterium]|jgi:threonylcarbamoyladenosine tRNA methylthiotransferase MtaB|nr:tRNA (N(6)-L-threonylcarbamoyladenosine(37)-C(2))-methylthiotransferase MtaB [Planctomycetaceae bacterium]
MPRFRLYTLGCKVNQYETEYLRAGLLKCGYSEVDDKQAADIVIVNTCTVTAESDAKSRKIIRKLIKENPGAEVIVTGCSVTHQPESVLNISGVTKIIPDKRQLPDFIRQLAQAQGVNTDAITENITGIERFGERHRAFVKVQDGCILGCSYCIIPKVRPVLYSRPMNEVLDEIRTLSQNGYREIVLTGIHLGHYGREKGKAEADCLAALVKQIAALDAPFRIRLSSLEAVEVSDELIDVIRAYPDRICPHLHLSMQSGSDVVLQRMKRRWSGSRFIERCVEIAGHFDRLALSTDVIVGFPGETDKDFEATCEAVRQLRFSKVHIFRYSPRKGTEAAAFTDAVPVPVQKERAAFLAETAKQLRQEYAASLIGVTENILMETPFTGTASRYVNVRLPERQQTGELVPVTITDAHRESCRGETVSLR